MNYNQYLLAKIAEEATEVAQRALKALTFGIEERQPGQDYNNAERLIGEIRDLDVTITELCMNDAAMAEASATRNDVEAVRAKRLKLRSYADYSRTLGIIDPECNCQSEGPIHEVDCPANVTRAFGLDRSRLCSGVILGTKLRCCFHAGHQGPCASICPTPELKPAKQYCAVGMAGGGFCGRDKGHEGPHGDMIPF